jgi:hypothetical protein
VESVAATHCLDACAVIAYVRQEPGAEVLKALIERPTTFLAMHVCNLGEVYYDFFRADGLTAAQTAWTNTLALPLALRRDADDIVGPPWCAQRWSACATSWRRAGAPALAYRSMVPARGTVLRVRVALAPLPAKVPVTWSPMSRHWP